MDSRIISGSQTEWVKFGNVRNITFVGRETICVGDGCHMVFYNLNTKEERIYTASDPEKGMGVACIAGHRTYPFFAFAEKSSTASIFVLTCPEFYSVSQMKNGTNDGYISLVFSEAEYLISLSGLPNFNITIWNWRKGDKIKTERTDILSVKQMLKCNYGFPVYLAQLGLHTTKLSVWEILQCGKKCIVNQHVVSSEAKKQTYTCIQWTSEGGLFVIDNRGDIYTVTPEYKLELVIKCEQFGDQPTYFSWFKAGLTVACPDGIVRHYKKSGKWNCDWEVRPEVLIIRLLNSPRDFLAGVTERGDIMLYNTQTNEFSFVKELEMYFNNFCMIYPAGEQIVTLSWRQIITAWNLVTGTKLDSMKFDMVALTIAENPEYPYFAVSFANGMLQLFSLYDGMNIRHLITFHLTENALSHLSFAESGKLLVAANMDIGEFFIIEGIPGTKMQVVATCCANRQIADYILVGSKTCLRLFVLNVTSDMFIAGNLITRFCIIKDRECPDVKNYRFESDNTLYSKLYATEKFNRDRVFYATPVKAKCLHILEAKRGDDYARLVGKIKNKHQMRKVMYQFDHHHIVSYGYDGLVIVKNLDFEETHILMPHHRVDAGVEKAYVEPLGKYVVSLGRNNVLICTNITNVEIDVEKQRSLRECIESAKIILMFKYPTCGFLPKGEYEGKTWLEMQNLKKIDEEYQKCKKQRKSILEKFYQIKTQVQHLLTRNLEGPENEYLDIQDFNLDFELKEEKWLENSEKCKETKIYLEKLIVAQDKVSKWVKEYCWDTMSLPGKSIYGIFSEIEVENYVLLPDDPQESDIIRYIEEQRALEEMMANNEIFEPWVPRTPSQMKTFMDIKPSFAEVSKKKSIYDEEDTGEDDVNKREQHPDAETITAFIGSITHTFFELNKGHYTQFQIQTFLQTEYQTILSKVENVKLRLYLNKEFDFLMSLKVREINNLLERNARLRHIISELNYFSEETMDIIIPDPLWRQEERPEQILEVKNEEVGITPYISPSQQAILDAEAAERERIRLLRLADDFKERALMAMMNGVLEIRWEDELRKNVPVPKCVVEKIPEDYNEEDLRAIRDYEEKVKFLESERLRYKRMLSAEYGNLGNSVKESIKRFNMRVEELLLLKIKVDSAIGQENLKINRLRLRNLRRIEMNKKEKDALKAIADNEIKIEQIQKLISSLHENVNECKNFFDSLLAKEKIVEKTFRRDMQDCSPTAQEIGQRLYKRRPKTNVRSITSVTILVELSKCIVTHEKSVILNQESLDFLRAMDNLDMYVGVPNAVDESFYSIICKHRRFKIESEIKMKAAQMEIMEAENTIAFLQKTLMQKKEHAHKLIAELAESRNEKIRESQDIEIQLVLKQGFVEIPTSGEVNDFEDAVMLSRKDIDDINRVILEAGNKKLKAMRDTMNFRRGIIAMEWEHKKMRMQIADLDDFIGDIRGVKVTKEIQNYMKSKARGESPDKGLTFEQEVDLVKQSYHRLIEARKIDVRDLQERIDIIRDGSKDLDLQITNINVDVCECKLNVDEEVIRKEKELISKRVATLIKRSKLVKQIQANHNEILVLQTELELLRLKTYPTLKYKVH